MKLHDKIVEVYRLLVHDDFVELDEMAAPGPPDANKLRVYSKDVGGVSALAFVDSAGVETTFLARQRYVPLLASGLPGTAFGQLDRFNDAVTSAIFMECRVPVDWVPGTNIIFNILILQTATAGSPTAVLTSTIDEFTAAGGAWSSGDIENTVNVNTALLQSNVVRIQRTVTAGASFGAGSAFRWGFTRLGADVGDTVNNVVFFMGAWMEYTAFF